MSGSLPTVILINVTGSSGYSVLPEILVPNFIVQPILLTGSSAAILSTTPPIVNIHPTLSSSVVVVTPIISSSIFNVVPRLISASFSSAIDLTPPLIVVTPFMTNAVSASSAKMAVTASIAYRALTADTAISSSYADAAQFSNVALSASTAHYASETASYALVAGYALATALTASYALEALSSSYAVSASYVPTPDSASYALQAQSSSYAYSASYALSASYVPTPDSSSYALQAQSASYAESASYALTASYSDTNLSSSFANTAISSSFISGGIVVIGLPTDGAYGSVTNGNISGVASGDIVEDALDKVEVILGKLAPAKPANLSARTLTIQSTYSAISASVGGTYTDIIANTQPSIGWTFSAGTSGSTTTLTYDGDSGILSCQIDGVTTDSHTMTTASDVGIYGSLNIVTDSDPYGGTFGQQNFWKGFIARINPASPLTQGMHTGRLLDTISGNTPLYTFRIDNPSTPTVSGITGSVTGGNLSVSGVPSLAVGDTITLNFTSSKAVSQFYNSTRINQGSSNYTNTVNATLPVTPATSGSLISSSIALIVATGKYSEATTYVGTSYNSAGTTGTATWTPPANIRIDTVSNEFARCRSGTGQYPAIGDGTTQVGAFWTSSVNLTGSYELQTLNGIYRYPPSVNYAANYPVAGPNYTALGGDPFESHRWATFTASISAVNQVTVTFNSTTNFTGVATGATMRLYVKVAGSLPTLGWIDGSTAYPGVGNPTSDGDAALIVGSSTTTVKAVNFGSAIKTGTVYVRIGIPNGSTRTFGSVTIS